MLMKWYVFHNARRIWLLVLSSWSGCDWSLRWKESISLSRTLHLGRRGPSIALEGGKYVTGLKKYVPQIWGWILGTENRCFPLCEGGSI